VKPSMRAGLAGAALLAGGFAYQRFWWGPGPEALERQRREVQRLGARLEQRLRERARVHDSAGDSVLVGMPAAVAERLAGEAVSGLSSGIRLRLRNLRFLKADEVRARLLLGRRSVGRFLLSVHVHEVRAVLRPAPPRLSFANDRVGVILPVAVEEGTGSARLRFKWDGLGMAGAVCGDLEVSHEVSASVPRRVHTLKGALRLSVDGSALVGQPEFADVELQVPIEPSDATWRFVDKLIAERSALCRAALVKADVKQRIQALLARGVRVTLPRRLLERQVRLPVEVERSLAMSGQRMRVEVLPSGVILTPAQLWYGVRVELKKEAPPL